MHEEKAAPPELVAEGELPEGFAAIRTAMEEAQKTADGRYADVDYLFEIPLRTARQLVGFKHDEERPHEPASPRFPLRGS